jgi:site-specific recombinase XerD
VAIARKTTSKPLGISKTVRDFGSLTRESEGVRGRPRIEVPVRTPRPLPEPRRESAAPEHDGDVFLDALVREWLLELKVMGRSQRTIDWYAQKMRSYLAASNATRLSELTAFELKRFLGELRDRGLAPNTIHGFFETLKALASWAQRERYPVDAALLRLPAPKVPEKEMETYRTEQLNAIFAATPPGWATLAIQILLGTGMRLAELCALMIDDVEDEGEVTFLKIRSGKGAKFRRVPISSRLRRELVRYLNRWRPETHDRTLLVLSDAHPVTALTLSELFRRVRHRVGFGVRAHKFRHTYATEYLRQGGEIERLRRILGHTTYVMVMRYVHLDKGDLARDVDLRSPF